MDRWGHQNLYHRNFEITINQIENPTQLTKSFIKTIETTDWELDDNKSIPFVNESGGNRIFLYLLKNLELFYIYLKIKNSS